MSVRIVLSGVAHGDRGPRRWWLIVKDVARRRIGRDRALVATSVGDLQRGEAVRTLLLSEFREAGIRCCLLPTPSGATPRLAIGAEDLAEAVRVLQQLPDSRAWLLEADRPLVRYRTSADRAARAVNRHTRTILVGPRYVTRTGAKSPVDGVTTARVEVWDELKGGEDRADGDPHLAGTRAPRVFPRVLPYLTAEYWDALCRDEVPEVPIFTQDDILRVEGPIDVVYTWVDGGDPEWLKRKAAAGLPPPEELNSTADVASRFASRDELKYSLRSLELYAPWVRHIYIVTDQQIPWWLDTSHPRVTIVDHREIFSDPSVLPVFNSHAIESQLHHIDGLSERYIYFNDDMMIGRPVVPEHFFVGNGLMRFFLSRATLDVTPRSARDLPVLAAAKRNADIISERFGRAISHKFQHTPYPQLRSVLYEMEAELPRLFAEVAASSVRHPDDISITSALQQYYAFSTRRAVPGRLRYGYVNVGDDDAPLMLAKFARNRDRQVFCLNDTDADADRHKRASMLVSDFLEQYFPLPSTFERTCQ